jgi:hypothetical protein
MKQKGINPDVGNMPKKLDISLQVCLEFSPEILLETCYKLLVHSVDLPHDKSKFMILCLHSFEYRLKTFLMPMIRHYF